MDATDPEELAQQLDLEAQDMRGQSERLGQEVSQAREDWEHKRADPNVPGAPPAENPQEDEQPRSPAPQAPPPEEGPSGAEEVAEMEVGPPADPGAGDEGDRSGAADAESEGP